MSAKPVQPNWTLTFDGALVWKCPLNKTKVSTVTAKDRLNHCWQTRASEPEDDLNSSAGGGVWKTHGIIKSIAAPHQPGFDLQRGPSFQIKHRHYSYCLHYGNQAFSLFILSLCADSLCQTGSSTGWGPSWLRWSDCFIARGQGSGWKEQRKEVWEVRKGGEQGRVEEMWRPDSSRDFATAVDIFTCDGDEETWIHVEIQSRLCIRRLN